MSDFIPYGCQSVDKRDVAEVARVLRSDRLTQGPEVERFEEAFARWCGAPYAVAVSNGTAALHLACLALGLKKGDEALTSPVTFVATPNAAVYCGATPRFADVHPVTANLDVAAAKKKISAKTKAVLPVHLAGQPCVWKAGEFGKAGVVEDACHALGAQVETSSGWKKVGSCHASDMAVFSFHPVKHITTGEGGMITTRRRELYDALRALRSHGLERNSGRFEDRSEVRNPWYYEMQSLGYNYRLTDLQCALGASQLARADQGIARRREIAAFYDRHFQVLEGVVRVPAHIEGTRSSYHLYVLRIDFKALKTTRAAWMENLKKRGIGTQVHYIPVTRQPYYRKNFKTQPSDYPEAERYYAEAVSIPLYPSMGASAARRVAKAVEAACSKGAVK